MERGKCLFKIRVALRVRAREEPAAVRGRERDARQTGAVTRYVTKRVLSTEKTSAEPNNPRLAISYRVHLRRLNEAATNIGDARPSSKLRCANGAVRARRVPGGGRLDRKSRTYSLPAGPALWRSPSLIDTRETSTRATGGLTSSPSR
ncbi:hypothetical protein EVAR_92824_1 [Eumeta japonica]|uniref:Uncharacterized protein n=1 Tax=Eumeta variegata TaxID=151549 RepID=A0A4C1T9U0_EUMVA|nr:hypothetical protein EVAR_92824_1 [Eumeta japonica]